jgi:hypothetical protein
MCVSLPTGRVGTGAPLAILQDMTEGSVDRKREIRNWEIGRLSGSSFPCYRSVVLNLGRVRHARFILEASHQKHKLTTGT